MRKRNLIDTTQKILTPQEAIRLLGHRDPQRPVKILRRKLKPLVFTNGCFDIIHPGHTSYLESARSLGSALIVAINSDRSVRAIKGPSRPINSLSDRIKVIAALECVTYVTWFDEDTPLKLIRALSPDILSKGGDWKPEQIVGSDHVLSYGGKVKSLRFVKGKSSTKIIEKLKKLGLSSKEL